MTFFFSFAKMERKISDNESCELYGKHIINNEALKENFVIPSQI